MVRRSRTQLRLIWSAAMAALVTSVGGCGMAATSPTLPPTAATSAPAAISSPPEWRPGDRWGYGGTGGSETGTKTVEGGEIREINKVTFYLVRVGDLEHFYTRELQWAGTMRGRKGASPISPPFPFFPWPPPGAARR